jgi:hypothetical protein
MRQAMVTGDFSRHKDQNRSRDSSVTRRWAAGWMIAGSSPGRSWEFFSSPPRPDRIWGPLSLLSKG